MAWWQTAWQVLRDVGLTGTGVYLMVSQVGAASPSPYVIFGGLALIFPAARAHVTALLSGLSVPPGTGEPSSPPAPPAPSSPQLPPAEDMDEAG